MSPQNTCTLYNSLCLLCVFLSIVDVSPSRVGHGFRQIQHHTAAHHGFSLKPGGVSLVSLSVSSW